MPPTPCGGLTIHDGNCVVTEVRHLDDRDLGINLDADPQSEVTIYDDRLALVALVGLFLLMARSKK